MSIKILITSDLHGRLDRFQHLSSHMRALNPDLVIDNGDFLDGSPSTFYYKHINKQLNPMFELANGLYDVGIFGNHEFQDGLSNIQSIIRSFHFPWISCNIPGFARPYFTKIINGKKFIVIGATTHFTPLWDEHNHIGQLTFDNALASLKYWVEHVKNHETPDYLIVSYHGGFSEDPQTGAVFQERTGENQANEILETIAGIDLLITGHQHLLVNARTGKTLIVQPASHGKGFFEVNVDLENRQSKATFHSLNASQVSQPSEVEQWLNEEIRYIGEDYTYEGLLASRLSSHPYIQLLHDMQLKMTNAQLSVCNLAYLQHGGLKNTVTNRDLLENASREHTLKVIALKGTEIKELIEQSAAVLSLNAKGEVDFSTNVFPHIPQPYAYDFWGGISYVIDLTERVGQRVKNICFQDEPIRDKQTYSVVFNSYRLTGYDFPLLKNRPIIFQTDETVPFLLKEYIASHLPSTVPNHGEFSVIAAKEQPCRLSIK